MKPLHLIAVLALAGLAVVAFRHLADVPGSTPGATRNATAESSPVLAAAAAAADHCLDEAALRRIVREELAALAAAAPAAGAVPAPPVADGTPPGAGGRASLDVVNQRIDNYIRAGAISDAEMVALQGEIGSLDAAGQREAIGRIVRAINAGTLKGRL